MSSRIVKIKNNTEAGLTAGGKTLSVGEYIVLSESDIEQWKSDSEVFTLVGNGSLIVNKGENIADDITDPIEGWKWLIGDTLPTSRTIGGKLAVHSSSKPEPAGTETFAVWTGAGDDLSKEDPNESIGGGELLNFSMSYDNAGPHWETKDVRFDPRHGRVWIHEAYIKFEDGGIPDYLTSSIMADPSPVIDHTVSLDLIVEDDWVKYSPGGPGTGTHGFAGNPILIPRPYSKDGDWDFDGTNLLPNFTGTGKYKISNIEREVSRYFNKLPCNGTSSTYFTMTSDETAELHNELGYFIRIKVRNQSNSAWNLSVIMEIFRERTCSP